MSIDAFINGLTFIFIFWRLFVLGSFIIDQEASKHLKWIVGFSFLMFLTSLFSSFGTEVTVKEVWRYILTIWLGLEFINGVIIPIVKYLYTILLNTLSKVISLLIGTDKKFDIGKTWLISLGIFLLEIILLSFWISFNYVKETDMIFDPRIKLIFNIAIFSLFIYSVVAGVGGWIITIPERLNSKYSSIKVLISVIAIFSISYAAFMLSLNRILERNDVWGRLNNISEIDVMVITDFFNDLNATLITQSLLKKDEHLQESVFNKIDDLMNNVAQADTIAEYYDYFFKEGLLKKNDSFELILEDFINTNADSKLKKCNALELTLLRYNEYYIGHSEFEDVFHTFYWHLRKENYNKYDQKKYQSEFLIYFARYAYYFQYEDLAVELFDDVVELNSELIITEPILGLNGFVHLAEAYNSLGKFHKAEKEINRGYYLFNKEEYKPDIENISELLILNEMGNKVSGIMGMSIARQRPDSKYALDLLRIFIDRDEGQINGIFSDYNEFAYLMDYRWYYEVAMNYLGFFINEYPQESYKVTSDVLSVIEKNKARSYKEILNVEWIMNPPELKNNQVGLNYILSQSTVLGQYYDADTTINFSSPIADYDLFELWESIYDNISSFIDPSDSKDLLIKALIPSQIISRIENKDLLISPDAILQEIPFQYLLDEVNISSITIVPAFSYLDTKYKDYNNLLTVSIPNPSVSEFNNSKVSLYRDFALDSLVFAPIEADNILFLGKKYLKGSSRHQRNATESWIKKNISSYDIVHFSAHSVANDFITGESGIYLNKDHESDGFLSEYEINQIELDGQFIFLSSCESGIGDYMIGEGTMSIAKAFLDAGASGIIASLWKVSDESVTNLSNLFYENFLTGISPEQALYLAQKEFNSIHPYIKYPFIYISF